MIHAADSELLIVGEMARIRADMRPELWDAKAEAMFRTAIENVLDTMGISKGPIPEDKRQEFDTGVIDQTAKLL